MNIDTKDLDQIFNDFGKGMKEISENEFIIKKSYIYRLKFKYGLLKDIGLKSCRHCGEILVIKKGTVKCQYCER